mmetsp:Transcript_28238/g.67829  ORF Transcript_28238/g.67829 Transcript_28238/m.67829 type:complete len:156 (-) Transcript_28238:46-513(-)
MTKRKAPANVFEAFGGHDDDDEGDLVLSSKGAKMPRNMSASQIASTQRTIRKTVSLFPSQRPCGRSDDALGDPATEVADGSSNILGTKTTHNKELQEKAKEIREVEFRLDAEDRAKRASEVHICYVCSRKFSSQEMLKTHEEFSELHQANLKKMK